MTTKEGTAIALVCGVVLLTMLTAVVGVLIAERFYDDVQDSIFPAETSSVTSHTIPFGIKIDNLADIYCVNKPPDETILFPYEVCLLTFKGGDTVLVISSSDHYMSYSVPDMGWVDF